MAEPPFLHDISSDTRAILLLCAQLGPSKPQHPAPLKPREYEQFARWLQSVGMRPADLLDAAVLQPRGHDEVPLPLPRLQALLDRGAPLAAAVDRWASKGLWIVSQADACYPRRLLDQPHFAAPPLLYGAGDPGLLSIGGLAIVGSRHADAEGLAFARHIAGTCAEQALGVVSGGARGVDRTAMVAALEAGGRVIGILADSLAKTVLSPEYREALGAGHLVLVSPYNPDTGFNVGNAMGRNKYIYALADWGLVINTALETGGTWAGALEAIKHGRRVLVRMGGTAPDGNRKLLELGACAFPDSWLPLAAILDDIRKAAPQSGRHAAYERVLQLLLFHLDQPCDLTSLACALDLPRRQAQTWVGKAIKAGALEKVDGPKHPRYILSRQPRLPLIAEAAAAYESCAETQDSLPATAALV